VGESTRPWGRVDSQYICVEVPEPRGSSVPRADGVGLLRDTMDRQEPDGDEHLIAEVLPANRGASRLVPLRSPSAKTIRAERNQSDDGVRDLLEQ